MSKDPKSILTRLQEQHNAAAKNSKEGWAEADGYSSLEITQVERELGFPIMGDYPLMKFLQQRDDLRLIQQREKEASKK